MQPENGIAFLTLKCQVLESGIKIVLEETGLEDGMKDLDFVITTQIVKQPLEKPIGVAHLAKNHSKKVLAFAELPHTRRWGM